MRNTKRQWFTLVELIVVITILAILGTIAFVSLQGYSADARNTKRTSNIDQIQSAISTKQTQWATLLAMVTAVTDNQIFATAQVAWTWVLIGTDYQAGTVNYNALGMKQVDFVDPSSNKPYAIGITNKVEGRFEIGASLENGWGPRTARILWNWNPRTTANGGRPTVSTPLMALSNWGVVTLSGTNLLTNLKIGDTVLAWSVTGKILNVSADGQTFTLDNATTTTWTINLASDEVVWLIDAFGITATLASSQVTTNGSTNLPY